MNAGQDEIVDVFVGNMGIKSVHIGDETVYMRSGGYFYIELDTSDE